VSSTISIVDAIFRSRVRPSRAFAASKTESGWLDAFRRFLLSARLARRAAARRRSRARARGSNPSRRSARPRARFRRSTRSRVRRDVVATPTR